MKMMNWLKFFKDKRFSLDFKIANFIMGDRLRGYLVVNSVILKEIVKSGDCSDYHTEKINNVITDLNELIRK